MKIVQAHRDDTADLAFIVSEANKDVAELFNINFENAPKHPSFYTKKWILSDFERGEIYFLYKEGDVAKGCVAFEQPEPDTAYLNRLSVLPCHRHNGIGSALVNHILDYSRIKNIKTVSIGIIAKHKILNNWYLDLGFIEGNTQRFKHLPFNVKYMHYTLS